MKSSVFRVKALSNARCRGSLWTEWRSAYVRVERPIRQAIRAVKTYLKEFCIRLLEHQCTWN